MFSWICQKCGSEVPPSFSRCPNCAAGQSAENIAPPPEPPPPPPAQLRSEQAPIATPVIAAYPPAAAAVPDGPRRSSAMPSWLAGILMALAMVAVLAVLYIWVLPRRGAPTSANPFEPAKETGTAAPANNPLARHLEITGLRLSENKLRRTQVQFLVVNHSAADLPDLELSIQVKAGEHPIGVFPFKLPSLGPYESREFAAPIDTRLREYEMPDWQFLSADFQITSKP